MRPTNIIEIDFFGFKSGSSETPPPLPRSTPEKPVSPKIDLHARSSEVIGQYQAKMEQPAPIKEPVRSKSAPDSLDWSACKAMRSRYDGTCRESGLRFEAGDWILYNFDTKLVYRFDSDTAGNYLNFLNEMRSST